MVKQRMGSVDVAGEVACLKQRVIGLRLANLYDINPKVGVCGRGAGRVPVAALGRPYPFERWRSPRE